MPHQIPNLLNSSLKRWLFYYLVIETNMYVLYSQKKPLNIFVLEYVKEKRKRNKKEQSWYS